MRAPGVRGTGALLITGLLAAGVTACSSGGGATATSTPTTAPVTVSAPATPVASVAALTGVSTTVTLSATFTAALAALKLTPAPVGSATLTGSALVLPITGGSLAYYTPGTRNPFVIGSIEHASSGLTLTAGSTVLQLGNFTIDPGGSKLYGDVAVDGVPTVARAYLFRLDATDLTPLTVDAAAKTATLTGTKVDVSPDAATLLDTTFKTTAVKADLEVGVATIVVRTG